MLENEIGKLNDLFFLEHEGNIHKFLLESLEKPLLIRVLQLTRGNQLQAARLLGINRNTLRTKIKHYGIKS